MSMPINSRITPPAILKAGKVIPKNLKISVPAPAKVHSTTKQVQAARRAMRRRCCWPAFAVMAKNAGTAAIGSTRKKVDVNATKENSRTGGRGPNIELQSSGRVYLHSRKRRQHTVSDIFATGRHRFRHWPAAQPEKDVVSTGNQAFSLRRDSER